MAIGDVIVGIDIRASRTSLIVGEVNSFNQIEVVCSTSTKSNGIQKGKIINETALAETLKKVVADAEKEMDITINSAYVTMPGKYVTIIQNSVTKEAKDKYSGISTRDVLTALLAAKAVEIPEGKQIIDIITNDFVLDDGKEVKNPVGSFASSFTLDCQIILGDEEYLKVLRNVFKKANIEIDGYVPIVLAEKNLMLEESEQKDSVMLLDVGAQQINIGVFFGERMIYTNAIDVGGDNITNDIAIVLGISFEEAEKLKKQYSLALRSYIDNDTEVVLSTSKEPNKVIKSSEIVEIIEARVEQMFDLINKDITNKGLKSEINTVVLTGQEILSISKSDMVGKITLNIPVKASTGKIAGLIKPNYATAYGLVRYIATRPFSKNISSSVDKEKNESFLKKLLYKIKEFFYS